MGREPQPEGGAGAMPLTHQIAAHKSWANTPDRTKRTANARNALENKFLAEADGDPKRAASLRKAYYLELAQKSAKARQRRRAIKEAARQDRITALLETDGGAA
jgi:hypothetical protein